MTAEYLRRKGGPEADPADAIVRARVEQADVETWSAAIRVGKGPFELAKATVKAGDLAFPRKSGLYDALAATVPDVTQTAGRDARLRWFTLVDLMKPKPRKPTAPKPQKVVYGQVCADVSWVRTSVRFLAMRACLLVAQTDRLRPQKFDRGSLKRLCKFKQADDRQIALTPFKAGNILLREA